VNSEPPAASSAAPGRCRSAAGAAATSSHHDVWRHRQKEEICQSGPWWGALGDTGRPRGKEGGSSAALTSGRPGPAKQRRRRRRRRRRRQQRWRCWGRRCGGPVLGWIWAPPSHTLSWPPYTSSVGGTLETLFQIMCCQVV